MSDKESGGCDIYDQYESLSNRLDNLVTQNNKAQKKYDKAVVRMHDLNEKYSESQERIKSLLEENEDLSDENEKLLDKISELEDNYERLKEDLDNHDHQNENNNLEELYVLEAENKHLKKSLRNMTKRMDKAEKCDNERLFELQKSEMLKDVKIQALQDTLSELRDRYKDLKDEYSELRKIEREKLKHKEEKE